MDNYKFCSIHKQKNIFKEYMNKKGEQKKYYYCEKCEKSVKDYQFCKVHNENKKFREYINDEKTFKYYYCDKCKEEEKINKYNRYANSVMRFGKHKDKILFDIMTMDNDYINWFLKSNEKNENKSSLYYMLLFLCKNDYSSKFIRTA